MPNMFRTPQIPEIPVSEVERHQRAGGLLLDVRERAEFATGHAPGAVNLPLSELGAGVDQLDTVRPVAVICRSGNRSAMAAQYLRDLGVEAVNVAGGMAAWQASGLATAVPHQARSA